MKFARGLLIFSYGLFTIAAQTLVFREFISTFEDSDITVGIFFGSWFLWIALGALLVYRKKNFAQKLLGNIEFLFLCYLPAFVLQVVLIINVRQLAGITSYTLLSIKDILLLSMVVNAPVSIITGMLFPTACRWVQQDKELAVSRVYIIEAAGSFLGGLGVTILLASCETFAKIFYILAFVVSFSAFIAHLAGRIKAKEQNIAKAVITCAVYFLIPLCFSVCLIFNVDIPVMRYMQTVKWAKLLPKDSFIGSFQTAQAEYLYGIYHNQWVVVRQGSTVEAIPDEVATGRIAAISLCQNPQAERILVVGSGLGLCYEFLKLPQIEQVTWSHFDSEYVTLVERFIPHQYKISDKRLSLPPDDVRRLLEKQKKYYDIVILNLPDATSSVLNRCYTLEFYQQVKDSLRPDGVFAVRVTGGENIMGTELINLGASTKMTLEKVFSKLVLTPGDETWFIVSDSNGFTGRPGILQDRFAKINGAGRVFTPQGLLSIYLPDRAKAALEKYSAADLPIGLLINRDSRPLANLYSLLFAAKQSGVSLAKLVRQLTLAGPIVFFLPLLVFAFLRVVYIFRSPKQGRASSFDSSFLVFSGGMVGIGVVIVLMYLYQTRFGSLYLHIGIISSVFMVGLTIGALLISYFSTSDTSGRMSVAGEVLLIIVILANILLLASIAFYPDNGWSHPAFAAAFILCGICLGCYFPLAARLLARSDFETGQAGSKLETADHIGACAGGLVTGLALVPVLGTKVTLFVFILLILTNMTPAILRMVRKQKIVTADTTAFRLRKFGYTLFGLGASIVICSNLLVAAASKFSPSLPQYAAQSLAGQLRLEPASAVVSEDGKKTSYYTVYNADGKPAGYIFSSRDIAPEITGFGGKMNLAVYVNTTGKLISFQILHSNETPSYLELLTNWRKLLAGHKLFDEKPFSDVQAVTGATVSSKAILAALETSGRRFAAQLLTGKAYPKSKFQNSQFPPDSRTQYLIGAVLLTLLVIYFGGFWSRLAVLILNLVVGGIIFNAQYSSEQVAALLSLQTPALGLSPAFLLALGVPLLVILFGNIYCGYLCPFGALQELLSYIIPERFKGPIQPDKMKKARFVKYVVLFVLITAFFISRNHTAFTSDPLVSFFNLQSAIENWLSPTIFITITLFAVALFYTRFWCRYLCPAGAILSLLNGLIIFKHILPSKRFHYCEFGLTSTDHLDCIYCDRCRYMTNREFAAVQEHKKIGVLVPLAVILGAIVTLVSISEVSQLAPPVIASPAASVSIDTSQTSPSLFPSAGQPRNVDSKRVQTMIDQNKLSSREAEFYKKSEDANSVSVR